MEGTSELGLISFPIVSSVWLWSSFLFLLHTCIRSSWKRQRMAGRAALAVGAFVCALVSTASSQSSTTTSFRSIFTVPASADASVPLIPNINDPQAVNAQDVCPGYKAFNVQRTAYGLTADLSLAGTACHVYGTDVDSLSLTVVSSAVPLTVNSRLIRTGIPILRSPPC